MLGWIQMTKLTAVTVRRTALTDANVIERGTLVAHGMGLVLTDLHVMKIQVSKL